MHDEARQRAGITRRRPPEEHAGVVPAEAHRVRQRDVDLHAARLVRHVVEVALGIGIAVVDRRRQDALVQRADAHHRLDRAGRPEEVPEHRLRRRDRELVRVRAEDRP